MNDIIIAYISPDIESQMREKITEVLRMRMIQTTDDIKHATVVIHSAQQMPGPGMTLDELAEKIVEQTRTEIFQLKEQLCPPVIPIVENEPYVPCEKQKNKHTKFIQNYTKQYNQTKQKQQTRFLTRTKCK